MLKQQNSDGGKIHKGQEGSIRLVISGGDVEEILPLLTAALDSGEKLPAPPMVKMKRPTPPKPAPIGDRYVCSGCGYEYVPELGDEDGEIAPGTLFEQLPAEWVCPECAETKDQFVKA